jgi:plasmid stability protein
MVTQILVRGLDPQSVERLKKRAKRNHRSLEAEVRTVLEELAQTEVAASSDFWQMADQLSTELSGRSHTDSAVLIREDRDT